MSDSGWHLQCRTWIWMSEPTMFPRTLPSPIPYCGNTCGRNFGHGFVQIFRIVKFDKRDRLVATKDFSVSRGHVASRPVTHFWWEIISAARIRAAKRYTISPVHIATGWGCVQVRTDISGCRECRRWLGRNNHDSVQFVNHFTVTRDGKRSEHIIS